MLIFNETLKLQRIFNEFVADGTASLFTKHISYSARGRMQYKVQYKVYDKGNNSAQYNVTGELLG